MLGAKKNVEVYETLEDCVDDVSGKVSPDVKLDNIQKLFLYFGAFSTLVFARVRCRSFFVQTTASDQVSRSVILVYKPEQILASGNFGRVAFTDAG